MAGTACKLQIAAAGVLLGACASLAPQHEPPPLPVPDRYAEEAADVAAVTAPGWRDYFADPVLTRLIEQALANNRDLRIAALRVREAQAAWRIQRAEQWPVLAAGAEATRARAPADLSITGQPLLGSQYQVGLAVPAWELDFWGRIESLKEAALQEYLATDAARRAAALSLVAQLAEQYLALCELDERLAIAGATVASRSESLRIFTRRYEVGSISRLDLTQVETLLRQAQVLQAQLEQSRSAQLHALALLLGTTPLMPQTLHLDDDAVQRELRAGLPSALLLRRPDILAAEHRLRAANADIGAARAAFFPSLSLTGAYGTASTELDGLFESGGLAWSFSPQLSLPIFDRGRRRAALEVAELRRDEAVASYERAIQTAFREVSDALSAQRWLQQQTRFLQEALDVQSERARLAQLRYDAGAAPYLEVLDAQRELLAAEQQLVQARRAALSARVQLYAALGGGTQDAAVAATE